MFRPVAPMLCNPMIFFSMAVRFGINIYTLVTNSGKAINNMSYLSSY